MKRASFTLVAIVVFAVAVFVAVALDGDRAVAHTSETTPCSDCHILDSTSFIQVAIDSETDTEITYYVYGGTGRSGPEGWGAFEFPSLAKVGGGSGPGTFTVPKDGTEYSVYWVDNQPGTLFGWWGAGVQAPIATTTTTQVTTTTTQGTTTTQSTTTTTSATTTTSGATTTTAGATTTTGTSTTEPASTTTTLPTGVLAVTG